MSVAILLNHSGVIVKDIVILDGNNTYGDLRGADINPYYTGNYSTHNAKWNNGVYVTIGANSSAAVYAWGELSIPVSFKKFSTLRITCNFNSATAGTTQNPSFYVGYGTETGTTFTQSQNFGSGTGVKTFDISNLTGTYYIKCRVSCTAWERSARMNKIELLV